MKTIMTYLMLILSMAMHAQKPLDTIYANEKMNVSLFFPKQIRQGITGAEHFAFTYNRDDGQYFGLLQATPGAESNLIAITTDGKVYSYILKYAKSLSKLNYFVKEEERIGNEKPEVVVPPIGMDTLTNEKDKSVYYKRFSEYLLKTKLYPTVTKRKKGMVLKLLKTVYNKNEVYLVMEVKNHSGIDFEVDYLNISRIKGNKKRKSSFQELDLEVIYRHKKPDVNLDGHRGRFVFVLPKFVLGDGEKLRIEMKELSGSRSIILKTDLFDH